MDDETKKRIAKHRIPDNKKPVLSSSTMTMIKEQATAHVFRALLKRVDSGEIDADTFVRLAREWLRRPS